ncbi:MAG: hypothetical protein GXO36_03800 [Chloroflexi bacterium]|nr:hypothetical protein [Chloroflexota bacterium]
MRTRFGLFMLALVIWAGLACNAPLRGRVTPMVATPDLTLTALFQWPTPTPAAPISPVVPTAITPLVTPTPALPTPEGPIRQGPTVKARRLTTPPTIDGDLTEWQKADWFSANHVIFGPENWLGPADVSAVFALGWDVDALYIAARVTDDVYVQLSTGFSLFKGDAIEIVMDTDLAGDFSNPNMNSDDYHIGFSPGYKEPGQRTEAYLWFPETLRGPRTLSTQIGAQRTEQGYTVEIRLPWTVLNHIPEPGGYYGFAFRVSDNDAVGRKVQQTMVSNVPLPHTYNDPTTWGNLVLLP